jgi:hypothetical protein
MRNRISLSHGAALVLGGAVLTVSGQALAANCPSDSSVVYVSGSSAFKSVLEAAQTVLGSAVTIIYQSPGSCEGLGYVLGSGAAPVADQDSAVQVMTGNTTQACTLPGTPAEAIVDIGISDVYPATCKNYSSTLNDLTSTQKDFLGPIQAMTISVPSTSQANSISAEAAYMVFKFAAATAPNTIAPWSIPGDIFVRYYDSGTLEMIGTALGDGTKSLPGALWANATCTGASCPQTMTSTGNMQMKLMAQGALSSADQTASIGILAAQSNTTSTKALAFQAHGQSCGYIPDSSTSVADRLNVRQGRYDIWGPEHLVVNVDGSGNPVGLNGNTPAVQALIAALTSTSTAPASASVDGGTQLSDTQVGAIIDAIAAPASGVVPQCAMQVSRTTEVGPEASYLPPAVCSCRYTKAALGTAPSSCVACTAANAATTCTGATTACRFGYCEVQ